MSLGFMTDFAFWVVLFTVAIAFVLTTFFFPQVQQNESVWQQYEQSQRRIIVYVKAQTYEQALKELEGGYLQQGWYISSFDYDADKKLFIFVLRKEETQ